MNGYEFLMAQNYIGHFREVLVGYHSVRDAYYRRWFYAWGPFGAVNDSESGELWQKRWEQLRSRPNLDLERTMYPYRY